MDPLRVALIGFGGYGQVHCKALAELKTEGAACLQAIAELNQSAYAEQLRPYAEQGVAIYADWREMLLAGGFDAVAVSAPLHLHCEMVVAALEKGYPVLCEKSAAVTVQDVKMMAETSARTGLPCAIDFQLLASDGIQRLKRMLAAGDLGSIVRISGVGLLKRTDAYYQRASWAGRFQAGGKYVLDGPMNNALAHMLNNMLYIASPEPGKIASPASVQAEMYRAQPLAEMEDTATVWVKTKEGPEVLFLATYCHHTSYPHYYKIEGTQGTATLENGVLTIERNGVKEALMEKALNGNTTTIYRNFVSALSGKEKLYSSIEESIKLARAQNGAYISSGCIHPVQSLYYRRVADQDTMATVYENIDGLFYDCAKHGKLPSDLQIPWATPTEVAHVADLQRYAPVSVSDLAS